MALRLTNGLPFLLHGMQLVARWCTNSKVIATTTGLQRYNLFKVIYIYYVSAWAMRDSEFWCDFDRTQQHLNHLPPHQS